MDTSTYKEALLKKRGEILSQGGGVKPLQTTMRILGLLENFFPGAGGGGTGRTEGAFQAQRAGEQMPAELSRLGLSPEEYAALRETLGNPSAAELGGLLSSGDVSGLSQWLQQFNPSELLTAGGGLSAEGAATAAREGLAPGGWGAGLPAGVYAAISAVRWGDTAAIYRPRASTSPARNTR